MSTRPHYQRPCYQDAPTFSQSKSSFDQNAPYKLYNFCESNVFKYIPAIHCCPPKIKLTATIFFFMKLEFGL
jgi:hypothetical protein